MASSEGKTEKATPKKRKDESKKGNVFQSKDVISALSILAIFYTLDLIFPYIYRYMSNLMQRYFSYADTINILSSDISLDVLKYGMIAIVLILAPIMLASMTVSVLATGAQTRFNFSKKQFIFKYSRISLIEGFKRLFSLRSLVELIKALLKMVVVCYVLYIQLKRISGSIMQMMSEDIMQAILFILNSIMHIVLQLSILFIVIAAMDYLYQWWQYEKNMKMSKQDLKDEYKQLEGNPEIKGKIKEMQRKISMRRMMQQVPEADVIIRNPTHFAVALKYNIDENEAPVVVAKGQDYMALKIIEIAEKCDIPMKEDKPLARALYNTVEINREIPGEFYAALAEIIAWLYTTKKKTE